MELVRIYEIPDCKMVSSGIGMFGEEKFERFGNWFSSLPKTIFPHDFLFEEKGSLHWVFLYDPNMDVPKEFDIIDFKGGLYAVYCDIDQKTDIEAMYKVKREFLKPFGYEFDKSRPEMGHIIGSPSTKKVLGYAQMDYWTPIKPIEK